MFMYSSVACGSAWYNFYYWRYILKFYGATCSCSSHPFLCILVYDHFVPLHTVLLQNSADPSIRNTDGKTAQDLAEPSAKLVLTGGYKKEELLEAAR